MSEGKSLFEELQAFAQAVKVKFSQHVLGEPEEQLRQPFAIFMESLTGAFNLPQKVNCVGEVHTPEGRPDFAISIE